MLSGVPRSYRLEVMLSYIDFAGVPISKRKMTAYQPSNFSDDPIPQPGHHAKDQGQGGFPGPIQLAQKAAQKLLPRIVRILRTCSGLPSYGTSCRIVSVYKGTDR